MNSTLTAALAGEYIAGLHRDAYHRTLAHQAQTARKATRVHRRRWMATGQLPTHRRHAAA